jgi:hypothetical protein
MFLTNLGSFECIIFFIIFKIMNIKKKLFFKIMFK